MAETSKRTLDRTASNRGNYDWNTWLACEPGTDTEGAVHVIRPEIWMKVKWFRHTARMNAKKRGIQVAIKDFWCDPEDPDTDLAEKDGGIHCLFLQPYTTEEWDGSEDAIKRGREETKYVKKAETNGETESEPVDEPTPSATKHGRHQKKQRKLAQP